MLYSRGISYIIIVDERSAPCMCVLCVRCVLLLRVWIQEVEGMSNTQNVSNKLLFFVSRTLDAVATFKLTNITTCNCK